MENFRIQFVHKGSPKYPETINILKIFRIAQKIAIFEQ